MLPIKIGRSEKNMGVCVAATCPHCQSLSRFELRSSSDTLNVFGIAIAEIGGSYDLTCKSCNYRKEITDQELSAAQAAQGLYGRLNAGELSSREYAEALAALDFPSLDALQEEAATWSCPICKEKVPATIQSCWKCSSPRPGVLAPASGDQGETPRPPDALTRPSNP